jgi:hypothetical protein
LDIVDVGERGNGIVCDLYLAAVSAVYAVCCVVVIFLTIAKRAAARSNAAAAIGARDILSSEAV